MRRSRCSRWENPCPRTGSALARSIHSSDRLWAGQSASYQPGPDWKENLRSLAHCTYQAYLAHPKVAIAVASRVTGGTNGTRIIDQVLDTFERLAPS